MCTRLVMAVKIVLLLAAIPFTWTQGPVRPVIVTAPSDHEVLEGSNLTLFCNAPGNPQPDITWTKEGYSTVLSISETLNLTNLRREDNGAVYSCKANNSLGFATVVSSITVRFSPKVTFRQCSSPFLESDDVTLECNATGNPVPIIGWIMESTGEVVTINNTLTLSNINRNDTGVYQCIAMNKVGNDTKNCTVDVYFPPVIVTAPSNYTALEGSDLTLFCNATGNPQPDITWTKIGEIILLSTSETLNLTNLTGEDNGAVYNCEVNNSLGFDAVSASITVMFAPKVTLHQCSTPVIEGDNVTLGCNATGNPVPSIEWIRESAGQVLFGDRIIFWNINRKDGGVYLCIARNIIGNDTKNCTVDVIYRPEFIQHPKNQTLTEGDNATFTCDTSGNPSPTLSWTKDGSVVNLTSRMSLSLDNTLLVITNVSRGDSGQYICVSANVVGTVQSSTATLNVQSIPSPPENVTVVTKNSRVVNISWTPSFNGNSDILNYTVEISTDNQTFAEATCPGLSSSGCVVSSSFPSASLVDLHPGRTYYIRVFATNKVGVSVVSSVITTTTDEEVPNAPPTNVKGNNITSTSIFVQWNEVPADNQNGIVVNYTVTYAELPSGDSGKEIVIAPRTNATLTGLKKYTNYTITVFASTAKGGGNKSEPIIVITDEDQPDGAPQNVRGRNTSSTSISVSWEAVQADLQNGIITGYNITYQSLTENDNGFVTTGPDDRQANLTGLKEFVEYNISVVAFTVKGDGPLSVIVVRTDQDKPDGAPQNVTGRNTSSTSISVSWEAVLAERRNGIITGYNITYQSQTENNNGFVPAGPNDRQANLTGLKEFVKYNISVVAFTVKGDGPPSVVVVVKTDEDKPDGAPQNVSGRNTSSTSILVSWEAVQADRQNGIITGYNITYQSQTESDNGFVEAGPNDRQANLTGLKKFVKYNISVVAFTVKGDGPSPVIVVRTDQDEPDGAPRNVRGQNTSSIRISVSWEAVQADLRNGIISGYNITYQSLTEIDSGFVPAGPNDRQANLTGLKEFVDYNISVVAFTVKGDGPPSITVVRTDEDKPDGAPQNVRGRNTSSTSISVSWEAVQADLQNGIITGYNITYQSLTENDNGFVTFGPDDRQANLTGLKKFVEYHISVVVFTVKGDGPPSVLVVRTDQDKPHAPPQNVRENSTTSTGIFVKWDDVPSEDQNGIIISYTVRYRAFSAEGPFNTTTVIRKEANLTGLIKDESYNVSVLATTVKGDGPYSYPKIFVTNENIPGAAPSSVRATFTSSASILVEWDEVPIKRFLMAVHGER